MAPQPEAVNPAGQDTSAEAPPHPRWWFWTALAGTTGLLAAAAWFLIAQGLDLADKYASVFSLLVAIVAASGTSLAALRRRRATPRARTQPASNPWGNAGTDLVNAVGDLDALPPWPAYARGYVLVAPTSDSLSGGGASAGFLSPPRSFPCLI